MLNVFRAWAHIVYKRNTCKALSVLKPIAFCMTVLSDAMGHCCLLFGSLAESCGVQSILQVQFQSHMVR